MENKYLRNILKDLVAEKNPNDVRFLLDNAMQEPIFSEFAVNAVKLMYPECYQENVYDWKFWDLEFYCMPRSFLVILDVWFFVELNEYYQELRN